MLLVRVDWVAKRLDLHVVRPGSRKHRRASFRFILVSTSLFFTDTGFVSLDFGSREGFDEELPFAIGYGVSWGRVFVCALFSLHSVLYCDNAFAYIFFLQLTVR